MKELNKKELKAVRIEVAVSMCIRSPSLYQNMIDQKKHFNLSRETVAVKILRELIRVEPSIGHILDFYYKHEGERVAALGEVSA